MGSESYSFGRLETEDDVDKNLALMREVFVGEGVDLMTKRLIDRHPHVDPRNFFTLRHGGSMVASLCLIPQTWSLGGVPLKVAEMGMVATLPGYRRRGLQRLLVDNFHRSIAEEGYDLSAIEGIPYFYRQFGYEYAIPLKEEVSMKLDQIPEFEDSHEVRPLTPEDIPRAMLLLAESQSRFLVHSVREEAVWRMQEETRWSGEWQFDSYAVEDGGEVVAYFRLSRKEGRLILLEASDTNHPTARSILSFLKEEGERQGMETLTATISHSHPLTEMLSSMGAIKNKPYAWQVRIIDHKRLFDRLKPLLESRLAGSPYRRLKQALTFNFYRFGIRMMVDGGSINKIRSVRLEKGEGNEIRFNPYVFPQLLLGHRSREELQEAYPDMRVDRGHEPIVDALFPKKPSYIHPCY